MWHAQTHHRVPVDDVSSIFFPNKGQVAMPLASGQRLGLKEDGRAEDVVGKDQTIVRPALDQNPFDKFIGALPAFGGTRTLKRWTAGLREDEA